MLKIDFYPPIGISGAALVGKDTLCNALIYKFNFKCNLIAQRCSIAGDFVRNDLQILIKQNLGTCVDMHKPEEKARIRPLMVEYGRYMRSQTNGRYFIDKINKDTNFGSKFIPIVPDIRYAEYEKDELFWLKKEKTGILIFLERKGIKPANKFEKKNNFIMKKKADFVFNIPTFKNMGKYDPYTKDMVEEVITTYLRDTVRLSDKS